MHSSSPAEERHRGSLRRKVSSFTSTPTFTVVAPQPRCETLRHVAIVMEIYTYVSDRQKRCRTGLRGTCHVLWAWVGACTMLFSRDAETTRSNILTHDISDTCGPLVAQGGCWRGRADAGRSRRGAGRADDRGRARTGGAGGRWPTAHRGRGGGAPSVVTRQREQIDELYAPRQLHPAVLVYRSRIPDLP